jgi:phosphatidylethanolamine/phosphatidyl-N-methylethanolamine N-methyltransferase
MCPTDAAPVAALANEICVDTQGPVWKNSTPGSISDEAIFLQVWLHQPAIIGAIMPTRSPLARAMAEAVSDDQPVIELGGGTGPITRALVQSGVAPTRLTVIERNPVFHSLLVDRFPGFRIVCGDAESLSDILRPAEMGQIGTIVSSLPRVGWPLTRQRSILAQCFAALGHGGVFLEFSYGPVSPVPRCLVKELGLVARRLRRVWRNFPPATIWQYRREGECLI